jgi:hypothetical protein
MNNGRVRIVTVDGQLSTIHCEVSTHPMRPQFSNELAWQQAEALMQPIYIRIIDRIRQESEQSNIQVGYEEEQTPHLKHFLCLGSGDRKLRFDIWDLCYQVCFINYIGNIGENESQAVEVDTSLFDAEAEDIDWHKLDNKAKEVVRRVFNIYAREYLQE